jgi:hypothetical protein
MDSGSSFLLGWEINRPAWFLGREPPNRLMLVLK